MMLATIMDTLIVLGLPLAGGALLFLGLYQVWQDMRSPRQKQLMERLMGEQETAERKARVSRAIVRRDVEEQVDTGVTGMFRRLGGRLNVGRMLEQANIRVDASQFLAVVISAALIVLLLSVLLKAGIIVGVFLAAAVLISPFAYMSIRRRGRIRKLNNQLPEVFELMGQALRAGHSLISAMELVYQEMPEPAGTEFGIAFQEQNLGLPLETALQRMSQRVGSIDLNMFVTAVLIQRQTGGDLAEIMDNIGEVIRDRIRIMGQVRALTAEGRLSGYALVALPLIVLLAMTILNPSYAQILFTTAKGRWLLFGAFIFQMLGLLAIRKIVNIKI